MPDFRSLISRMADELDHYRQLLLDNRSVTHRLADEARAALAEPDGPAVPDGREPASVNTEPSGPTLAEMVRQLRTKAATEKANRCHYSATLLTRAADLLAQRQPQPVPVSERLPGAEDCDAEGRCWIHMPDIGTAPSWRLVDPREIGPYHTHWLPVSALPLPQPS